MKITDYILPYKLKVFYLFLLFFYKITIQFLHNHAYLQKTNRNVSFFLGFWLLATKVSYGVMWNYYIVLGWLRILSDHLPAQEDSAAVQVITNE